MLCDYAAIAIQNARSVELIHELTITDDCTGLFNARHLYTMLDEQIALAAANRPHQFSLLFVDLDRFKQVNDTHGHLIGSRLLAEVGSLMKRVPRARQRLLPLRRRRVRCPAARHGQSRPPSAPPCGSGKHLRNDAFPRGRGPLPLPLAGSFGLATFPEDGNNVQAIIRAADTRCMLPRPPATTSPSPVLDWSPAPMQASRYPLAEVQPWLEPTWPPCVTSR